MDIDLPAMSSSRTDLGLETKFYGLGLSLEGPGLGLGPESWH